MKQNQSNLKDYIYYLIIVVIVILCFYLLYYVKNNSMKCMASPLTYGVSQLGSANGEPITCQCSYAGSLNIMYVTKDNITTTNIQNFNK